MFITQQHPPNPASLSFLSVYTFPQNSSPSPTVSLSFLSLSTFPQHPTALPPVVFFFTSTYILFPPRAAVPPPAQKFSISSPHPHLVQALLPFPAFACTIRGEPASIASSEYLRLKTLLLLVVGCSWPKTETRVEQEETFVSL